MSEGVMQMMLRLDAGADADAHELNELTTQLRRQLLELDLEAVDRVRTGETPPGARAADFMALGALVVTLGKSPGLMKGVIGVVQSWLAASHGRSVELQIAGDTIKVGGLSLDEQQRLVDLFVQRHSR